MRITGGTLKGRRLEIPRGLRLRPSTDKIRSAVFSVLGEDIVGAAVADLFCGSGAFGLEALSRGAVRALFIDSSRESIAAVSKNIAQLDLRACTEVKMIDVYRMRPRSLEGIGVVFADPPYGLSYGDRLISLLCLKKFAYGGILALEHEGKWKYDGHELRILKSISFGDYSVTFLRADET